MKKLQHLLGRASGRHPVRTPVALFLALASAVSLWFSAAPRAIAAPPMMCMVCHKHVVTLSVPCGSAAYHRHIDHGDAAGACGATTSNTFLDPLKPSRVQPDQPQQQ
jgi:hypothetical protein